MSEETPSPDVVVSAEDQRQEMHWPSAVQFGLSLLAVFFLWSMAAVMLLAGLMEVFFPQVGLPSPGGLDNAATVMMGAASAGFAGGVAALSAVFSALRLLEKPMPFAEGLQRLRNVLRPSRLVWLMLPLLGIGYLISTVEEIAWLFLPPVHIAATVLPLLWLVWLGVRFLPKGSAQRDWGALASGLMIAPTLAFFVEMFFIILLIFSSMVYFVSQPELLDIIEGAVLRLSSGSVPEEQIPRVMGDVVNTPAVFILMMLFIAVITPVVEEIFKPIGVWLLAGRDLTPQQGALLGVISGAGFALYENLVTVGVGVGWAPMVLARVTTGVMHIVTAGLTGWALVTAWRERRYGRLVLVYLLSVGIHAMWNAAVLVSAYAAGLAELTSLRNPPILPSALQAVGPVVMGILTLASLYVLWAGNKRMRGDLVVEYAVESGADSANEE